MVPEGTADFGNYVRDFIGQGYNVIFGTSFGYMDDMLALADEYPDVVFEHISGYKANDTNFGNTFGRMYEPRYLSGMVAGSMASSKINFPGGAVAGDVLPDTVSPADWAAPGVELRYTPGKMDGPRGVQDNWAGKIVGSGWPVGETVYLIPCTGSYDTFDYSTCRYDDASPGGLVVDDDGNITTYHWNIVEMMAFWGPLGRAESDCTLASTYGPDGRASTGDEIEAVLCDDPMPPPLIGYVAAFPIPEVIRGINAFTLGVREVNPAAEVEVNWTSTWFDPAVEGDAAQALLDKGADVIAMHQDSTAAGQAAEAAGARWVSYNSDMSAFAPEAYLTAPVWDWGPRYVEIIEAAQAGTYTPGYYWGSMADGVVDLAPIAADVDSGVTDQVMAAKAAIIAGDLHPFTGPLHDQAGNLILADGAVMDDGTMLGMSFFVDGVIGSTGAEVEAAGPALSGFTVVSEIVQDYVDENELNGASLIVLDRDAGVLYEEHFGELRARRIAIIGPLAEIVSAGVVLRLHDDGLLDVDAPVADVVAWGSGNPEVTLAQLLSHSSGILGGPASQFYAPYLCSAMFVGSLQGCGETIFTTPDDDVDLVPPDTNFGWPGTGADYQVAGAVAEAASGKTWAELVDEIYVQPCGLDVLAYNSPWFQLPFDPETFAYPALEGDLVSMMAPTENPSIMAGAYTTANDYAAVLLMHLRDGMCGDERVLSTESLDRMHEDRIARVYDGGSEFFDADGNPTGEVWGYGMGFAFDRETGRPAVASPFGQQAWLDLDEGYAVLLLLEATWNDSLALYDLVPGPLHEAVLTARG
ncbi:MAG: BMP family ABC transporter substrate-binding protein, partial [Acidimicrobiales bacterium]|nr:BMP family ABC transporter substrate-binding protein [Acidimicrobiales bacterium]